MMDEKQLNTIPRTGTAGQADAKDRKENNKIKSMVFAVACVV
jgi:hypothetical protein